MVVCFLDPCRVQSKTCSRGLEPANHTRRRVLTAEPTLSLSGIAPGPDVLEVGLHEWLHVATEHTSNVTGLVFAP
jgi:hypothetical protein